MFNLWLLKYIFDFSCVSDDIFVVLRFFCILKPRSGEIAIMFKISVLRTFELAPDLSSSKISPLRG